MSMLLSLGSGVTDMFERAKSAFSMPGIGISKYSRAHIRDFMDKTSGDMNKLFSAQIDSQYTIEGMAKIIMAKRAQYSTSSLASYLQENPGDLQGKVVDKEA